MENWDILQKIVNNANSKFVKHDKYKVYLAEKDKLNKGTADFTWKNYGEKINFSQ